MACDCTAPIHEPHLVVLTGGPGAGKTAVLEIVKRNSCEHVHVLPEAAGIVFAGGFPREHTLAGRAAAQRAIRHVQRELERAAVEQRKGAVILCDRGTLDGLAYWPFDDASWFEAAGATREEELARYARVIHLRTPPIDGGYDRKNPLRIETALEAREIDRRIERAWAGHPDRVFVESDPDFMRKVTRAIEAIREALPLCCRNHRVSPSIASSSEVACTG
jgi:predicted ATPase